MNDNIKKLAIFGAAHDGREYLNSIKTLLLLNQVELVGFFDNDSRLHGKKVDGYDIYPASKLVDMNFDLCVISVIFYKEIVTQLEKIGVDKNKVSPLYDPLLFDTVDRSVRGLNIGKYSYFKPSSILINTEIGRFTHIGDNCQIGLVGHDVDNISTYPLKYHFANDEPDVSRDVTANHKRKKQVNIKNDVYIGEGVVIFGGVTIGNGAVIGARSVVTRDVGDYEVVAGIPAKTIQKRFSDKIIKRLLEMSWWNWDDEKIKNNMSYLNGPALEEFIMKDGFESA